MIAFEIGKLSLLFALEKATMIKQKYKLGSSVCFPSWYYTGHTRFSEQLNVKRRSTHAFLADPLLPVSNTSSRITWPESNIVALKLTTPRTVLFGGQSKTRKFSWTNGCVTYRCLNAQKHCTINRGLRGPTKDSCDSCQHAIAKEQ